MLFWRAASFAMEPIASSSCIPAYPAWAYFYSGPLSITADFRSIWAILENSAQASSPRSDCSESVIISKSSNHSLGAGNRNSYGLVTVSSIYKGVKKSACFCFCVLLIWVLGMMAEIRPFEVTIKDLLIKYDLLIVTVQFVRKEKIERNEVREIVRLQRIMKIWYFFLAVCNFVHTCFCFILNGWCQPHITFMRTELRITVGEKSILTFHAHSYRLTPSVLIAKMRALVFSRRKDLKTQPLDKFTSFTIPRQTARGKAVKEEVENSGRKSCKQETQTSY